MHRDELTRLSPGVRGFWTDEELRYSSNLISVPLLKKLQQVGLVRPKYAPVPGGGRQRIWTLDNVARVQLAQGIAGGAGIAIQAVAALLVRAGVSWVDNAADISERAQAFAANQDAQSRETGRDRTGRGTRIVLVGMEEAWLEERSRRFTILSSRMKLSGSSIYVPWTTADCPPRDSDPTAWGVPIATIIDLSAVQIRIFDLAREDRMAAAMSWS